MADRRLVTPFFLDRPSADLRGLAGSWVNDADPAGDDPIENLSAIHAPLAEEVAATLSRGERPVSIAGDCCAVIPVIAGLQRAGIAPRLLWLDAHGDFNTAETSPSGFIGGMPLAMLVGRGDTSLLTALGMVPIPESDVHLCDARDLDPEEGRAVARSEVRHHRSIDSVFTEPLSDRPLHVHLDVDVLSLDDAPAVLYPVPGGPRVEALVRLGRHLAASRAPISASITTWVFEKDAGGRTARSCLNAFHGLLGG